MLPVHQPVTISTGTSSNGSGGRLDYTQFNLPLYGDPVNDFTQYEDLVADQYNDDNGNSDDDGMAEVGYSQDDEIRSDFDFDGFWEDYSDEVSNGIPVFRHYNIYTYERDDSDGAILQFGASATKRDGTDVIWEEARLKDIAPDIVDNQTPTDEDLSVIIYSANTMRFRYDTTQYRYFMWHDGTGWQNDLLDKKDDFVKIYGDKYEELFDGADLDYINDVDKDNTDIWKGNGSGDFAIVSTGVNPSTSDAIGIYIPQNSIINQKPVVGINTSTRAIEYEADRRMRYVVFAGLKGSGKSTKTLEGQFVIPDNLLAIGSRVWLTGLQAPEHCDTGIIEGVRQESFVLFGTPAEILASVNELEAAYTSYSDTSDEEWNFADSTDGWTDIKDISGLLATEGSMTGQITGVDPILKSPDSLGVYLDANRYVKVKLKNMSAATSAQLYFTTTTDTIFNAAKMKTFTISANDEAYTTYILDMDGFAAWTGDLKQLRVDPAVGVSTGSFEIDYVKVDNAGFVPEEGTKTDDISSAITYTGAWGSNNGTVNDHDETIHNTASTNASAEYTFEGTSVAYVGRMAAAHGIVEIFIDGVSQGTVDMYSPSTSYQSVIYTNEQLSSGSHTIKIVNTGTKNALSTGNQITLDYFITEEKVIVIN